MTPIVFDTSAWIGYLKGDDERLRELVDSADRVLTAGICLPEVVSWAVDRHHDPEPIAKVIGFMHEIVAGDTETILLAGSLDRSKHLGERMTLAIAVENRGTAVFYKRGRLRLVPHDKAPVPEDLRDLFN